MDYGLWRVKKNNYGMTLKRVIEQVHRVAENERSLEDN